MVLSSASAGSMVAVICTGVSPTLRNNVPVLSSVMLVTFIVSNLAMMLAASVAAKEYGLLLSKKVRPLYHPAKV